MDGKNSTRDGERDIVKEVLGWGRIRKRKKEREREEREESHYYKDTKLTKASSAMAPICYCVKFDSSAEMSQ